MHKSLGLGWHPKSPGRKCNLNRIKRIRYIAILVYGYYRVFPPLELTWNRVQVPDIATFCPPRPWLWHRPSSPWDDEIKFRHRRRISSDLHLLLLLRPARLRHCPEFSGLHQPWRNYCTRTKFKGSNRPMSLLTVYELHRCRPDNGCQSDLSSSLPYLSSQRAHRKH